MISFAESAEKCNNKESGIPDQTKDKSHCFCLELARTQGEEAAVILQGLGYKVAKSKKVHDGKKWHYDPLRALEEKWPYLKDSGIHGIIERQVVAGNIVTARHNKQWWRDRTTWYSVPEQLQKRALENEGKIWFDVPVAVKCESIIAGTLYQNLRFQLLLFLADHPDFAGAPYHLVNKSALSRYFPWSLSTIKRHFKNMCKAGIIAENPECEGEYTLCDVKDLIVPKAMQGRSSTEMRGGSSTEKGRSSTEMTGSSTEMTRSSTDNITHYKTIGEAIHKHHSPPAAPDVLCECADAADAALNQDNKQSAGTVPVSATSATPTSLEQIRERISTLKKESSDSDFSKLAKEVAGLSSTIAGEDLPIEVLRIGWHSAKAEQIIPAVYRHVQDTMHQHGTYEGWTTAEIEFAALRSTEIITGAFLVATQGQKNVHPEFSKCWDAVWNCYEEVQDVGDHPGANAEDKANSLLISIRDCNTEGWASYSGDKLKYNVPGGSTTRKVALEFFERNPEVTSHDAWKALSDCVEVHEVNASPKSGFDPFWKSRRGVAPKFLFKYWDDIQAELSATEILWD